MKIKLYFFGKKNEIDSFEQEMIKRIGFRAKIEVVALSQAGLTDVSKTKEKEADSFLSKICDRDFVVAFDEHGKTKNSVEFSHWLKKELVTHGEVVFVIGGAYGLDQKVLSRANFVISFGVMVWTRNLFRKMALEQIYRALEIDGGGHFHKA